MTWSFISEAGSAKRSAAADWRLANPISEEMKVMRPSLLPGLIAAARRNLDRGASSVRLFELGRRYLGDAEHPTLSLLLAGEKRAREWQSGKAQTLRFIRRQGRGPRAARSGGRADREPAGLPRRRLDLAPRPLREARSRAEDDRRQLRRASPAAAEERSMRRRALSPPKSISTRSPPRAPAGTRGRPMRRRPSSR